MDPTISPSCATWLSMSCERTTPSLPCVESSSSQAGMTNTWPSLSLNFEMRLPCIGHGNEKEPAPWGRPSISLLYRPRRSGHRLLDAVRGERHAAHAHAGGVEDRVGDGGGDRPDRGFARPCGGDFRMVDQHGFDRLGGLGDVEDRVTDPVHRGHVLVVELDLFPQGAADALHDVALDALGKSVRIDDLAAVVGDHEAARVDLAGRAIDLHLGDHCHAGTVALRVGDAATADLDAGLALRRRTRLPAELLGCRFDD